MQRMSKQCPKRVADLRYAPKARGHGRRTKSRYEACLLAAYLSGFAFSSQAVILWSDLGATLANNNGDGQEVLAGAVRRDNSASDSLYFKLHVDPMSDVGTEEYFAAFQLYEAGQERLAVGNSLKAWAYSAFKTSTSGEFNKVFGDIDLSSSRPESSSPGVFLPYELPRRGIEKTIVFKVQYVPNGDDAITVWLDPDLAPGATEHGQPDNLVTRFTANASFDSVHLRHSGGGSGWTFGDMAVATAFSDFVYGTETETGQPLTLTSRDTAPFTFRAWQREQGLPQNSVRALAQTSNGYLWIGTDDGVTRFDGMRFVTFGPREGWRGGRVRVLFEDAGQRLWIGTDGAGLICHSKGRFLHYSVSNGLPSDVILSLTGTDYSGRTPATSDTGSLGSMPVNSHPLFIGTASGLAVWQDRHPVLPELTRGFSGASVTALHRDTHGAVWIGAAGRGVFRYAQGELSALHDPTLDTLFQDPHCILHDRSGRLWIGAGDDYLLCREGDQWRRYRIPRHLARPYIASLAEDLDGTVWAGSLSEGLFQFKAGKLASLNAGNGLSDNTVQSLLVDSEANLWVGTGAGLNRLRRKNLSVFGAKEGLGYGPLAGLAEVAPGIIWAAKPGEGVFRWSGRDFSTLPRNVLSSGCADTRVLLSGADGSCWAGGGYGLFKFEDPSKAEPQPQPQNLAALSFLSLAPNVTDGLWAGTREGQLWEFSSGSWHGLSNAFLPKPIVALAQEPNGTLWVGTDGAGLFHLPAPHSNTPQKVKGLLSDSIRALHLDPADGVWIGTAGGGLAFWNSNQLSILTTREGLPDNTVSQILEDDTGRLWLGTSRGIVRLNKSQAAAVAAGKSAAIHPLLLGRSDGMLSEECSGGFSPAALKSANGWLWFPTTRGLVVLNPNPPSAPLASPAVILETVYVDNASAWPAETPVKAGGADRIPALRLAPGQRRVEFHYTGLSFSAPEQIRFRYKLEGLDPDWVEAGARRSAFYAFVPPGQYRFLVSASNVDGVWTNPGASLQLTVLPHFWQTRWFLVLAGVGLLVSVGGISRLVEKRKLHRRLRHLEAERALEKERARIARDLHDDLGSSLTRMSLLSDLVKADRERPELLETHAQKLSFSAAQTVRSLEEIVWALRPGSDSLQSLIQYIAHFATELFEGDEARCRLDLPPDLPSRALPPEMRHNIFLVVKEALTNALKHARAREVRVQAKASLQELEILVQDDGCGFESKERPLAGRQRNGLENMQRRAETIGGALHLLATPGEGTSVRLTVPFPSSSGQA